MPPILNFILLLDVLNMEKKTWNELPSVIFNFDERCGPFRIAVDAVFLELKLGLKVRPKKIPNTLIYDRQSSAFDFNTVSKIQRNYKMKFLQCFFQAFSKTPKILKCGFFP